jgi:hypothetical protein
MPVMEGTGRACEARECVDGNIEGMNYGQVSNESINIKNNEQPNGYYTNSVLVP